MSLFFLLVYRIKRDGTYNYSILLYDGHFNFAFLCLCVFFKVFLCCCRAGIIIQHKSQNCLYSSSSYSFKFLIWCLHMQILKKELDGLKDSISKIEEAATAAGREREDENRKAEELRVQFRAADDIRQAAYSQLQSLRKELFEEVSCHFFIACLFSSSLMIK